MMRIINLIVLIATIAWKIAKPLLWIALIALFVIPLGIGLLYGSSATKGFQEGFDDFRRY